jgi:repressor LexA
MPTQPLTDPQRKVFEWVRDSIDSDGISPSYREIASGVGLNSTNAVKRKLDALERKGWITRQEGKARTIQIIEPDGDDAA